VDDQIDDAVVGDGAADEAPAGRERGPMRGWPSRMWMAEIDTSPVQRARFDEALSVEA